MSRGSRTAFTPMLVTLRASDVPESPQPMNPPSRPSLMAIGTNPKTYVER